MPRKLTYFSVEHVIEMYQLVWVFFIYGGKTNFSETKGRYEFYLTSHHGEEGQHCYSVLC